jgi:hypothetical protein
LFSHSSLAHFIPGKALQGFWVLTHLSNRILTINIMPVTLRWPERWATVRPLHGALLKPPDPRSGLIFSNSCSPLVHTQPVALETYFTPLEIQSKIFFLNPYRLTLFQSFTTCLASKISQYSTPIWPSMLFGFYAAWAMTQVWLRILPHHLRWLTFTHRCPLNLAKPSRIEPQVPRSFPAGL